MTSTSTSLSIIDTAKYTHVISDFRTQDLCKFSSISQSPKHSEYKFELCLFPKGTFQFFLNDRFYCLWISPTKKAELFVQYRVWILDANGLKHCTKEVLWNYTESKLGREHSVIRWLPRNYLLDPANGLLPEGKLTIYCEVDVLSNKIPHIHDGVTLQPHTKLYDNLQKDFESLLKNGKLSDVVLVVGGKKEIHAHKNILSARSKVFGAMFENKETKESMENRVEIHDVDVEVFEELLMFIYTGKIPETDKNALELFVVADKYQVDYLKSICEQTLCSSLTIESVSAVLLLSDMHNAEQLKSERIEYAVKHAN